MTLWYFNINDFPDEQIQDVLLNLPESIALEIDRYKFNDDKKYRLISRLLIQKYVLETSSVWDWEDWRRTENHKPFFENGPFFNISHSGKIVIVGFSTVFELGVDIEEMKDNDAKSLSSSFHKDEVFFLEKNEFNQEHFYSIWTRKEALLKAIGIGFLEGLNQISVLEDIVHYKNDWFITEIDLVKNYRCSICTAQQINNINSQQIDYNTLNKFINEKILL